MGRVQSTGFEEWGDKPIIEGGRGVTSGANGSEQVGKEGGPTVLTDAPEGVGEAVRTGCRGRRSGLEGLEDFRRSDECRTGLSSKGGG